MTNIHHAIDYVELPVSDLPAARSFYERAFGWQFNEYGPVYAGIKTPVRVTARSAGSTAQPGLTAARPLVLLYSDDLDATVGRRQGGRRDGRARIRTSSPAGGGSISPTPAARSWASGRAS